jgi:uncharacterized membrane protein
METIVTLIILVGGALLWSAINRIGRLEHRLGLLENERDLVYARQPADDQSAEMVAEFAPVPPKANAPTAPPYSAPAEHKIAAKSNRVARIVSAAPIIVEPEPQPEKVTLPVSKESPVKKAPVMDAHAAEVLGEPVLVETVEAGRETPDPVSIEDGPVRRGISFNFEDLFGRRLPIWAGGITLAIAGILIVKYAIDAGFFGRVFTPWVQSVAGILFGTGLIAGAEFAHKNKDRVDDPRVSQALSGAGIATLYGAFLVAGNVYGLISPLLAFFGLACVTAAALWLSMRHGVPTALLGLAGGLAAPAMVGGVSANVPLLAVYLALTIAGLTGVSRMQRWPWLALAGLIGGAGWSLWMILASSALDLFASLSIGGFVILLAIALPMLALNGPRAVLMRSAAALAGAVQLAMLVAMGGFMPLHWGLFALLAAAGQWLAWRDRSFDIVPSISLGLSVFLLAIWPGAVWGWLMLISISLAVIHGAPLFLKLWQSPARVHLTMEYCGLAVAAPLIAMRHSLFAGDGFAGDASHDKIIALVAAVAATLPVIAIAAGWKKEDRFGDIRFALLTTTMGALIAVAAWFVLPHWQAPIAAAIIAAALLFFGERARDERIEHIAIGFAALSLPAFIVTTAPNLSELATLISGRGENMSGQSLMRWGGLAAIFALFAYRAKTMPIRIGAHGVAGGLAYAFLSLLLPVWALPLGLAAVAAAMLIISIKSADGFGKGNANIYALGTLPLLMISMNFSITEVTRLFTGNDIGFDFYAVLRWGGLTALFAAFAAFARGFTARIIAHWFTAVMAYGMLAQIIPGWSLPLALSAISAALLFVGLRRDDRFVEAQSILLGIGSIMLLLTTGPAPIGQLLRLFGDMSAGTDALAGLRWAGVAALAAYFAVKSRSAAVRHTSQALAALLGYGAIAQIIPSALVPLIAPVGLVALAFFSRRLAWPQLQAGLMTFTAIAAGWAMVPLAHWMAGALVSLAGQPLMIGKADLSALITVKQLLVSASALFVSLWLMRAQLPAWAKQGGAMLAALLGGVAAHSLYRLGFAQMVGDDFASYGLGQRLVWAGLLIALGSVLWRKGSGLIKAWGAPALIGAASLHTFYYSLLLHNPLWTAQAVGAWPAANLILPLFIAMPLGLHLLRPMHPSYAEKAVRGVQLVHMLMICGFAWATLRQAFHGTLLIEPGVSSAEDISRSILGIALAVGFLVWGIKAARRDWRLASLVLVLIATVKVFLFDAAGLDGLLRIGSFIALGFSLIGIGWLYSRQLGRDSAPAN